MPRASLTKHSRTTIYFPPALVERLIAYTERTGRKVNVSHIARDALVAWLDKQEQEEETDLLFLGGRSTT